MNDSTDILSQLQQQFGPQAVTGQPARDDIPTACVGADILLAVLRFLKEQVSQSYPMLYDLFGIDERSRSRRPGQPQSDFTVVYHLLSLARNSDVRIKVSLQGDHPAVPSITSLWPSANWYERELWDMFGVNVSGHPDLRRILLPPWWQGHALRKEHPARATEMPPFTMSDDQAAQMEDQLEFRPEEWGLSRGDDGEEFMFLNLGPHHPGTHGVLRLVLQMQGDEIVDMMPDIGFHHRGAEKMGERQSWHTYIPYTDRVDYLGGVTNNLPYVLAVEKLAGIEAPERAMVIRVMLCELYRIASHLVFYGTFVQDLGMMSPVFYMFTDREHALDVAEAITGARMHPGWFRIGGVSADLPEGWQRVMEDFLDYLPKRLDEYDKAVLQNPILKARTRGIGCYTAQQAIDWGVTGPGLRSCGVDWDLRKKRPYSGYDWFEFDVPVAHRGDCYDRLVLHVQEIRQSLRIIRQCIDHMPGGDYKSRHPLATPPIKPRTMEDIETLITHFLGVSWGPVIPAGEATVLTEGTKGQYSYHLVSDGGTAPYRSRIRTPSFPHIQMVPQVAKGLMIPDLIAVLGAVDFVLADVDR